MNVILFERPFLDRNDQVACLCQCRCPVIDYNPRPANRLGSDLSVLGSKRSNSIYVSANFDMTVFKKWER